MGKLLIQQRRGKGSMRYRAPSFRYQGKVAHRKLDTEVVMGVVADIIHCPGHSAPLQIIKYANGEQTLTVVPEGMRVGDKVESGHNAKIQKGNTASLKNIPEGTLIFNVEKAPGDGGKFIRTSGTFGRVVSRTEKEVRIIMPSKKEVAFNPNSRAQIGIIAGGGRTEKPFVKAGAKFYAKRARNKLWPKVSGTSMNAVDHPFGGSSSHHHGKVTIAPKYAPAGRKVGKLKPRRTGKKR